MTISTTASRISYNGNGITTIFAFPYRFLANADIMVVEVSALGVETAKVLTTDYTLTGAGDDLGGSITMITAPASGTRLVIYRDTAIVQETDYVSGDPFPAETHETALDRLTMIAQEQNTQLGLTLRAPIGIDSDVSLVLPLPQSGKLLGWNTSANALQNISGLDGSVLVSSFMEPFLLSDNVGEANDFLSGDGFTVVGSIASLRAVEKRADKGVFVTGYYAAGDGGGGTYRYDASDTTTADNGGTVIVATDGGRWKLTQPFPPSFKQWGAKGDGTTDDTTRIQAALDSIEAPGGALWVDAASTFKVTSTLYWGNGCSITGAGTDSIIKGASMTTPILQSKGTSLTRRYRLQLRNLNIDNTTKAAIGGIGCDLRNATDCLIDGVLFSNVETGVQHFGDTGLGCYYNELRKCVFSVCTYGVTYSTLANENWTSACRFNNVTVGYTFSDGSHNHITESAIELFTTGILISGPAYDTQITSPRLENLPTSGTGISITGAAVRTSIKDPQYIGLTTNLNDAAGINTTRNGRQRVTAVLDFGSIAAGATADLAVAVSGAATTDTVQVTPPSTLASGLICIAVPSSGQHYVRVANVTAGAIDPASATFTLDIWRKE